MRATLLSPEGLLPIHVRGELRLDAPSGRSVRVEADGNRVMVDAPGWRDLSTLGPSSLGGRRRAVAAAARHLATMGMAVNVTLRGRRLVSCGAGVRSTFLSRALGLPHTDLRFSSLVSAWRS